MNDAVLHGVRRPEWPLDPIAYLTGQWSTERRLLDRAGGVTGRFSGTTTFTPYGDGLRWDEEGILTWPRHQGPASRSYRVSADGPTMTVRFPDGRVLCSLDLSASRSQDEHLCAPDTYRVDFTITSPDSVDYSWDVTGPAKDLLLTTQLNRRG